MNKISKKERKEYNKMVEKQMHSRESNSNVLGMLALVFLILTYYATYDFAIYTFGVAVLAAFASWLTRPPKEQEHE